jgi:hypothetical protein
MANCFDLFSAAARFRAIQFNGSDGMIMHRLLILRFWMPAAILVCGNETAAMLAPFNNPEAFMATQLWSIDASSKAAFLLSSNWMSG